MKEFIEFEDVYFKVDEIFSTGMPGYVCSKCGKSFLILQTDKTTGDFNILYNDKYEATDLGCDLHINFDLLMDSTLGMVIPMPKKIDNRYLIVHPEYAMTFLFNRLN